MNKKITIPINMNTRVKFLLSSCGLDIYKNEMEDFNSRSKGYKVPLFPKRDDKGFVENSLWSVINMYGKQIGLGLMSPFADNCIHIEVDLKEILEQAFEEVKNDEDNE